MNTQQRGGTLVGLIVGIVAGLGIALAVAAYINKVPVPFVARTSSSAEQDAAEAQRNRHWNPNAALQGQIANAPPPVTEIDATGADAAGEAPADAGAAPPATTSTAAPDADPLGELLAARTTPGNSATAYAAPPASAGAFQYFVQAGAFRSQGEADAQRARLAMLGWEARVSELEQNGSTLYRVRVGPFARRDDAEQLKQGLGEAGVLSTLVRTPRG